MNLLVEVKENVCFHSIVRLFAPQVWQQSVRHRGKLNLKFPRPRHEIPRFLEEITKPVIEREVPDPIEKCIGFKSDNAKRLKLSTNDVSSS